MACHTGNIIKMLALLKQPERRRVERNVLAFFALFLMVSTNNFPARTALPLPDLGLAITAQFCLFMCFNLRHT